MLREGSSSSQRATGQFPEDRALWLWAWPHDEGNSFILQGHIAPTQLIQHERCHLFCVNSKGLLLDMQMALCGASPRGICDPIAVKRPTLEAGREQFSNQFYELSTEFSNLYHFPPLSPTPLNCPWEPHVLSIYKYIFSLLSLSNFPVWKIGWIWNQRWQLNLAL